MASPVTLHAIIFSACPSTMKFVLQKLPNKGITTDSLAELHKCNPNIGNEDVSMSEGRVRAVNH